MFMTMATKIEKPLFRKEVDMFVLYKPESQQIVGTYKTWQEAQMESIRRFGRKASKIR